VEPLTEQSVEYMLERQYVSEITLVFQNEGKVIESKTCIQVFSCLDRTRRTFKPNIQTKTYYSKILDREIKLRVSTKAIRCINKAGNFDTFILQKDHLIADSEVAQQLRKEMQKTLNKQQVMPPAREWTKFPYY